MTLVSRQNNNITGACDTSNILGDWHHSGPNAQKKLAVV